MESKGKLAFHAGRELLGSKVKDLSKTGVPGGTLGIGFKVLGLGLRV